ncbi:MAG: tetratricopeptide repeat protein [Chloroflexi bacterium]|nr:tetratricopeptide repeat protein [Chloroflexota bacterium]
MLLNRRIGLLIGLGIAIALIMLIVLVTPIRYTLGDALLSLWRGVLDLPGVAWLREQGAVDAAEQGSSVGVEMIDAILEKGHELQQQEVYDEALKRYREALRLKEDYAPTHVALASLYMQRGMEDEALQELERAAAIDPDIPLVMGQLGRLYLKRDELDKAVSALERAVALDPEEALYRYFLGMAYHYRSYADIERAVQQMEMAAKLRPEDADVHYHLAMVYVRRGDEGDQEAAIKALERSIELDPQQANALFYLGQLYWQADRTQAAAAAWRRFLEVSDDPERKAQVERALASLKQGS